MKKTMILMLCFALLLSMAGCSELESLKKVEIPPIPTAQETPAPETEASPEPAETAVPEAATETETEEPVKNFSLMPAENLIIIRAHNTLMQEMDPAEGTQIILTYSYDTPKVHIEGRDDVSAKINEYLGLVDEAYYTGSDYSVGEGSIGIGYDIMLEAALDNFSYHYNNGDTGEAVGLEYSAIRNFDTLRADSGVLSLMYHSSSYMGGANGNSDEHGFVFDTETGERLSLDQLSSDFDAFTAFLVEEMVSMAENDDSYKERISFVEPEGYSEAFSNILLREDSWCFDNEGMIIFSSSEELGPHAAGIAEFKIPYEKLQGKIDDRFIPAEKSGDARFKAAAVGDMKGDTEIIDKLKVDENGAELCLIAEGNVYDVRIVTVSYSDKFYEMDELWYCSEMAGTALQIQTNIPDGIPNLMLKYRTSDGEEHRFLISQSGKDGRFILSSDDIEVKG